MSGFLLGENDVAPLRGKNPREKEIAKTILTVIYYDVPVNSGGSFLPVTVLGVLYGKNFVQFNDEKQNSHARSILSKGYARPDRLSKNP